MEPTSPPLTTRLDRFVASRAAAVLACVWGLAEATFFFLVPDVLLTLLGCRAVRPAIRASLAALVGALVGGALMYEFGAHAPQVGRSFLDHIPAINQQLITSVQAQLQDQGLWAVMIGPSTATPYKIYALEWGANRNGLASFLLISIPARYLRFLLTPLIASGIARLLARWTQRRAKGEILAWATFWLGFYGFYFGVLGW